MYTSSERLYKRDTERERQKERETHRDTERKTDRESVRERERYRDKRVNGVLLLRDFMGPIKTFLCQVQE